MGEMVRGVKLTSMEYRVFLALTDEPTDPAIVAQRAQLTNMHIAEAGAKYCIALTKKGLAVASGKRTSKKWARAPDPDDEIYWA
jgi:hypothetical protein